jgi:2TM domain
LNEYDDFAAGAIEHERAIRHRVHRLGAFYKHLFTYIIVVGVLWVYAGWPFLTGILCKSKWEWMY